MHRPIPRSALLVACLTALMAFAAGSAQAAIKPVTLPASAITATTAQLNGALSTGGALTQWEFSYNFANNLFGGSFSPGGFIAAGTTALTPVTDTITNLTPSTTYTFELIASNVTYGTQYYLNSAVYGLPALTFTTTGPGFARLASTKLKVKKGRAEVPIRCSKALACTGGVLAITARHHGKKVSCGSATFSVKAGKKKTVHTSKISATCKALLLAAPKSTIKAKLVAGFDFQKGFTKSVSLKFVS